MKKNKKRNFIVLGIVIVYHAQLQATECGRQADRFRNRNQYG